MEHFDLARFVVWYLVFIFSTTCHEAAHALLARRGGDDTAYSLGHVTLDPMPHIRREPFGMVVVPILSYVSSHSMFGWASVPYDPTWGARYPRRWAVMSLAGPLTNFLLAGLALLSLRLLVTLGVFHVSGYSGTAVGFVLLPDGHDFSSPLGALAYALSVLLQLNVILGIFNLIPIPPLDGAAVVEAFGPSSVRGFYERMRVNPMFQLLGLLFAWWLFPRLWLPAQTIMMRLLYL